MTEPEIPLLPFDKAQAIGKRLQDRWEDMTGPKAPEIDELTWSDVVAFVVRCAREGQP